MKTLIIRIGQLVTNKGVVDKDGIGVTKDDLTIIENGELLIEDGLIRFVGPQDMIAGVKPDHVIDAKGCVALPALVDPHTHAIFAGSRHDEFEKRSEGQSYLDIAEAGGGITASTNAVDEATADELAEIGLQRIETANRFGVGAMEIKSGYGLTVENELKMLEAISLLADKTPVTLVPTFMGAHAVPEQYKGDPDAYVEIVIKEMLPLVVEKKLAAYCDVFAEKGFFSIDQARKILLAAKELGLGLKLHADEFEALGGAQLAAEVEAISADHLLATDDEGIAALAKAGVTAVLLPGTSLFLGEARYANARKMIDDGVRVALATDLNPGSSYTENMLLILTLACTSLKMTVAEAIAGATYNAAKAIGLEESHGALLPGRAANIALFCVPDSSAIPYHMGVSDLSDLWVNGQRVIGDATIDIDPVLFETEAEKGKP